METKKLCPIAAAHPDMEDAVCLGESCACYVKIHILRYDGRSFDDPERYLRYNGCGLVNIIPWEPVPEESAENCSKKAGRRSLQETGGVKLAGPSVT